MGQKLRKAHLGTGTSRASSQPNQETHAGQDATVKVKSPGRSTSDDLMHSQPEHAASGMSDARPLGGEQQPGRLEREQQVQPLQQGSSQQASTQQQALSGDQLAVLYSSCLKLASENKIDKHNSWQLGLIDHLVILLHPAPIS